ncbi:MAG: flippase [Candidatus Abawacabacteria bacterium]|nr:flippase [Candidatus Abawacabacteria bacterium]
MENAKKIASNTISQIISRLFNAVLSVVIIKIITHYLRASGYGEYTLVYELVGFFGLACDLGLFTLAVDEMSKQKERMQEILGNMLGLRLILILVIGSITSIAAFVIPTFTWLMSVSVVIATIGMAAYLIGSTVSAALQVHLKMPQFAFAVIVGKTLSVIYIALAAWFDWGFLHLIIAGVINNFYVCTLSWYTANKLLPIRPLFNWQEIYRLLKKSAVYGTALILGTVYLRINSLILGEAQDSATVGVFGVALRSYELLLLIPFSFMNSVLPSLSAAHMDENRFNHLLQKSWDILVIIGLGMCVGSFIMAESMIQLISTGTDFAGAADLMRVMVIASIFNFLSNLFQYILVSLNQVKAFWWITLIEALVAVTFAIIFTPTWAAYGTAWAVVLAQGIHFIGLVTVANRTRKIPLNFKTTLATIISIAICAGYLFIIRPWLLPLSPLLSLPLGFGSTGVLYIILLTLTGGLAPDLLLVLKNKLLASKVKE